MVTRVTHRWNVRRGPLVALAVLAVALIPPAARAADTAVEVGDNFYDPARVEIDIGTTVLWSHESVNPHSVTSGSPGSADAGSSFESSPNCSQDITQCMKRGDTYRHRFDTPGTFAYFCRVHGAAMAGTVTVLPAGPRVEVGDNFYNPARLEVNTGTTVVWRQSGNGSHSVTSGAPGNPDAGFEFDSSPNCSTQQVTCMKKGDTFRNRFTKPGTYPYSCRVHGLAMTGTITVRGKSPTPGPTGTPPASPSPSPKGSPSGSVATSATSLPIATQTAPASALGSVSASPSSPALVAEGPGGGGTGGRAAAATVSVMLLGAVGYLVWRRFLRSG